MIEEADEVSAVSTNGFVDTIGAADRRNKRWPETLKRQIVAETRRPGSSVSMVARRYDVNANQVFKWRRHYEAGSPDHDLGPVPVLVRASVAAATGDLPRAGGGTIEIELASGARVRVSGAVDGAALSQVLERLK